MGKQDDDNDYNEAIRNIASRARERIPLANRTVFRFRFSAGLLRTLPKNYTRKIISDLQHCRRIKNESRSDRK